MPHPTLKGSHLATADAAALLGVSPATLKRWAQSGLIASERTEGGHRRFRIEDVRALLPPEASPDDLLRRSADLLTGPPDALGLQGWLLGLRRELGSWWAVSLPLRGLVAELQRRRAAGALGAIQVEVALDRLRTALLRFQDTLVVPAGAPGLLVASVPGDPFQAAPALLQLAAPECGWRADWAGHPEVPALAEELRRAPIQALAVCGSLGAAPQALARHAAALDELARTLGVPVALVGMGAWPDLSGRLARCAGVAQVRAWLEGLPPGAGAGVAAAPDETSIEAPPSREPAGADAIELLRWDPALALGHQAVDAQHETLFAHARGFHEAVRLGQAAAGGREMLRFIADYAQVHFRVEEALMRTSAFPGLAEHVLEHEQFTRRLGDLARQVDSAQAPQGLESLALFLSDWLRSHVGGSDQRIGEHLRRAPHAQA